jgi:hypothetical protein
VKKALTPEPGRKMRVIDDRTIVVYDPQSEDEHGRPLPIARDVAPAVAPEVATS